MGDLTQMIRDKRSREGLSLRQASEVSGVAFSTLGRIENGAEPSLRVDRKLREWLEGAAPILPTPAMTLRDWFAGQAMAAFIANPNTPDQLVGLGFKGSKDLLAECAYSAADAMIATRSGSAS